MIARRGPEQAAFTNPELLELGELADADVIVDPDELALAEGIEDPDADTTARRNVEILRGYAARDARRRTRGASCCASCSPRSSCAARAPSSRCCSPATRSRPARTARCAPRATDERIEIPASVSFRAVGYRGTPLAGVPFDERRGLIANEGGRVRHGEYVVGWAKRGPSGVIGTNKKDANDTVDRAARGPRRRAPARPRADHRRAARGVRPRTPARARRLRGLGAPRPPRAGPRRAARAPARQADPARGAPRRRRARAMSARRDEEAARRGPRARRADRSRRPAPGAPPPGPPRTGRALRRPGAHDRRPAALDEGRRRRSGSASSPTSAGARRRPQEVLAADPEELRAAGGLSRAKTGYLRSLAEHVIDGSLELDRL